MSTSGPDAQASRQAGSGQGPGGVDAQVLLHDLANSMALLPQEAMPEGEEPPEGAIALPVIEQDGTQYVPVFTSEEALRAAGADPATALQLPIAQLAATWPGENLWLAVNPATPEGLTLPPEVVRALPGFVHLPGEAEAAAEQGEARRAGAEGAPSG
ncbi:SseB family protein [Nocardioides panacis]|uniref:SseB family protein n=1 Tax=Nocardioides panacis TaxID=2849501 RepID=A0A975Y0M9_9ACTN|nr:SseB family protein [Nocardioides panacis]QWZ08648.1 SseB family protein [Nocardioides panacis]